MHSKMQFLILIHIMENRLVMFQMKGDQKLPRVENQLGSGRTY